MIPMKIIDCTCKFVANGYHNVCLHVSFITLRKVFKLLQTTTLNIVIPDINSLSNILPDIALTSPSPDASYSVASPDLLSHFEFTART